jgi:hypothetical protein
MPFPRTWTEELITEWLALKEYAVESGIPISTTDAGGRNEVDVIGYKITNNNELEIIHIEITALAPKEIEKIEQKFSETIKQNLVEHIRKKINIANLQNIIYKKIYVDTYSKKDKIENLNQDPTLKEKEIQVKRLIDLIINDIIPTIKQWKKSPPHKPKGKEKITLPDSYWLLKLIDYLMDEGLIKTEAQHNLSRSHRNPLS